MQGFLLGFLCAVLLTWLISAFCRRFSQPMTPEDMQRLNSALGLSQDNVTEGGDREEEEGGEDNVGSDIEADDTQLLRDFPDQPTRQQMCEGESTQALGDAFNTTVSPDI